MHVGFGMGGGMFSIIPFIMGIFFLVFIGFFLYIIISGIKQWGKNNASPVLTVHARVVTKRGNVSRRSHMHDDHRHTSSSTQYYATFQVESGDRIELSVSGLEYGMLVEGDEGQLTFQGTRYQGFHREQL